MLRVGLFSESHNADATHILACEAPALRSNARSRDKDSPTRASLFLFSSRAGQHCPPRFEASVHFSPIDVETAGSTASAAPSSTPEKRRQRTQHCIRVRHTHTKGKALESRNWKTQPEGTRGCYRLEVRKLRFYQQTSAMLMLVGAEHP